MPRYCPCGRKIEQKPNERQDAFEKRQYCDGEHRTRYHKPPPPKKPFGIQVPQDKLKPRVGEGMLNFLYGRPV